MTSAQNNLARTELSALERLQTDILIEIVRNQKKKNIHAKYVLRQRVFRRKSYGARDVVLNVAVVAVDDYSRINRNKHFVRTSTMCVVLAKSSMFSKLSPRLMETRRPRVSSLGYGFAENIIHISNCRVA